MGWVGGRALTRCVGPADTCMQQALSSWLGNWRSSEARAAAWWLAGCPMAEPRARIMLFV
jgi:hypothetical protein